MKRITTTILSMMLAAIFLLSFTGIRLLIHQCMSCDSTDIHLFVQVDDCCDHHSADHSQNTCTLQADVKSTCCNTQESGAQCEDCCKDEVVYLKKDYELNHYRSQIKVEPVSLILEVAVISLLHQIVEENDEPAFINYIPPPPSYVGREFVLFSHQIKIG